MKFIIFFIVFLTSCNYYAAATNYQAANETTVADRKIKPLGSPLFLTKYLEKGLLAEARRRAWVFHPFFADFDSYAGLFTVNKAFNSNIFFWFFPSQRNYTEDPLLLWFNNEPAATCLLTIFNQNGPLSFNQSGFKKRDYALTVNHSVIYMDIIGTGFSFTDDIGGYARNQDQVARDIILALIQFYELFPELQLNDFYVGGNAFGGQYAISVAKLIKRVNENRGAYINLKGIVLGNGLIDVSFQKANAEFLYQFGLIDKRQKKVIKKFQDENRGLAAFNLEKKITGYTAFNNILNDTEVYNLEYARLVENRSVRRAINVGNLQFAAISPITMRHFGFSLYKSLQKDLEFVLRYYRVLVFNGQMDYLFPYATSQELYQKLNWPYAQEYKTAQRQQWWLDGELAGYVKSIKNFEEVLIRNSGHVTFIEQPKWTCELITRFTHNSTICQEERQPTAYIRVYNYIPI